MAKRTTLLAVTLMFACHLLRAQDEKVGTTVFNFLKTGEGARPMGMAGAFTAVSDDANSLFWNPAGLCQVPIPLLTSAYRHYVAGIKGGYVAYARPQGETGYLGVGMSYLDFGTMSKRDLYNNDLGTFHPSALVPTLGFGMRLTEAIGVGMALKGIYQTIDTVASYGLALDLGSIYEPQMKGWKVGAVIRNLGVQVKPFGEEKEPLPLTFKLGASYQPVEALTLGLDLVQPVDNELDFRLGAEWKPSEMFALRAGYYSMGADLKTGDPGDVLGGFSFGLGTAWKRYSLDYAVTPMVALGIAHKVSFSIRL